MFKLTVRVNGRAVSLDEAEGALEKASLEKIEASLQKRVAGVRCVEHGTTPHIVRRGLTTRRLSWEVRACCKSLLQLAVDQLKGERS